MAIIIYNKFNLNSEQTVVLLFRLVDMIINNIYHHGALSHHCSSLMSLVNFVRMTSILIII